MTQFSASDAALEGFNLIRRHWRIVMGWAGFNLLALVMLVVLTVVLSLIAAAMNGGQSSGPVAIVAGAVVGVGTVTLQAIIAGGVFRLELRSQQPAFLHLRLGRDELRLVVVWLITLTGFWLIGWLVALLGGALLHLGRPWIVLAAVPSALLISVTAHISTDIAAAPFMWVIPLALYLVTFVIVFQTRPILPHNWMIAIEPLFIVALVGVMVFEIRSYLFGILALNVIVVFVITLVCHGELSRTRPDAQHLTAFYMWMSAGGVIGGIFAGLIAPNIFTWVLEYPALIVVAILCRPGLEMPTDLRTRLFWLGAIAVVAIAAYPGIADRYVTDTTTFNWTIGAMLVIAGLVSREPLPFAAVIAVVFIIGQVYRPDSDTKETMRSFFGVHKITETSDGTYRVFLHGTTIHGAERMLDDNGEPLKGPPPMITYYHDDSPMGVTVKATRARVNGPIKVAVVGLGTGTFACFKRPQDNFTFYEIDASVVRMARDPNHFRYITGCAPDVPIRLGDARLTLADAKEQYDLIVLDAFSSDAIPIHLMTQEAMATYLARLAPHGIVLMHVSNRHMELASVVAGIAHANGVVSRMNNRAAREGEDDSKYVFTSTVVISAREDQDFGVLRQDQDWSGIEPPAGQRIWTDDYSNVIGAVIRQYRKKYESAAEEASEPETSEKTPEKAPEKGPEKAPEAVPVPAARPEIDKKP